jgi:hypothetical protein
MLTTALSQVSALVGKRSLRNTFFPTLVLFVVMWAVVAADRQGVVETVDSLAKQSGSRELALLMLVLTATFLGSAVLDSAAFAIIQSFEGYWGPAHWLRSVGVRYYRPRRARAVLGQSGKSMDFPWPGADDANPVEKLVNSDSYLQPTRLGNVLRAAEQYPAERYGANAVVFWPILYPLLPDSFVQTVDDARSNLEFYLNVSVLGLLFAGASGVYFLGFAERADPLLFAACWFGGAAVAYVMYRTAVASSRVYGQYIRVAFDLHRFEIFEQLHRPVPATLTKEREQWEELQRFVVSNDHPCWTFAAPTKAAKDCCKS